MDFLDGTDFEQDLLNQLEKAESVYYSGTAELADEKDGPKREHLEVLSKCFGHKKFRPLQWKIINSIITDRRDNCAIMTTGYGKSLCYQFPSVFTGGITVVISPLISLMEDQVRSMKVANIAACLLGTANTKQNETIDEILDQKYSLVYLTPEFCTGEYGKALLENMHSELSISLIAIDEAHCLSSWGHDFRPQYRHLGMLKKMMPDVPILAVTATATPTVIKDINAILKLRDPQLSFSGFDRPNLYFAVHLKGTGILQDLRKVMERRGGEWKFPGSTIIYCITRKETEDISLILSESGIKCLPYHAGLSMSIRKDTHEKFVRDKIDVITATIAFGMGIDKPDVRNIVHYGASNSVEGYYQEVGRAGRDGLPAKCVAFYANKDFEIHRRLREHATAAHRANKETLANQMRTYLSMRECRREFILSHFEGKPVKLSHVIVCCDNCTRKVLGSDSETFEGLNAEGKYDFTEDAKILLQVVKGLDSKFGLQMYILFLRGSRNSKVSPYIKNPLHGSGKHKSEDWWKGIGSLLEKEDYLKKVYNKGSSKFSYYTLGVSDKGAEFLRKSGTEKLMATPTPEIFALLQTKKSAWLSTGTVTNRQSPHIATNSSVEKMAVKDRDTDSSKEATMKLYQLLLNRRYELATLQDCMPYSIASNKALMDMASYKPITLKQLKEHRLDGFTDVKVNKFGGEFLRIIRDALGVDTEETATAPMSIQDALDMYPLSGAKIGTTAQVTYSLFKSGLALREIAAKRGVTENTITSHLIDCMKLGYTVKMSEMGVTSEIKTIVLKAIGQVGTGLSLLTPIKNACPPEITFNQVKAVVTYLQIREHLTRLNCAYEDFESDQPAAVSAALESNRMASHRSSPDSLQSDTSGKLAELLKAIEESEQTVDKLSGEGEDSNFSEGFADADLAAACDQLENSFHDQNGEDSDATVTVECDPPAPKRPKTEYSFGSVCNVLDSPPHESRVRRNINAGSGMSSKGEEIDVEVCTEASNSSGSSASKKNAVKLPPWLTKTRIA